MRQVIDRVADTITLWGTEGGYFVDQQEIDAFNDELKLILVTQRAAFNSPVWFNIGVKGVPQQAARASSSLWKTRWTASSTGTAKKA